MDYIIAIPSYQRVDTLKNKTLQTLQLNNIDKEKIHIFVANEQEKNSYSTLPQDLYGKIVVGVPGLKNQRNFIFNYFPENTLIVSIDDDIKSIKRLVNDKLEIISNLDQLIQESFQECKRNGLHLWGVYPIANSFFMKAQKEKSLDTKFIIGHLFGIINSPFRISCDLKQDYELSLYYSKLDGGVLRNNSVCCITTMGAKGGINKTVQERQDIYQKCIEFLLQEYPDRVRINTKRTGEILLKHPRKK